jgi:hypothetical protein
MRLLAASLAALGCLRTTIPRGCPRFAPDARGRWRRAWSCSPGSPPGSSWPRSGLSRSWGTLVRLCPVLGPRRNRWTRPSSPTARPPHKPRRRLPASADFGAVSHGFGAGCLRFAVRVAPAPRKTRFRLWPALPVGIGYPKSSYERFPISILYIIFLLSQAFVTQGSPGRTLIGRTTARLYAACAASWQGCTPACTRMREIGFWAALPRLDSSGHPADWIG